VKAQLQKLISQLSGGEGMAAASVDLPALLARQQDRIAALSASQPDPSRFVPVDTMRALQEQVAALTAQVSGGKVDELVVAALSDGRLLPAQETWARELGQNNLAALKGYLDTAPKIAALSATQTQGNPPAGSVKPQWDEDTLAACSQLGLSAGDLRQE
ncbi:phage protease, partial [Laribacter hongkongensis]